MIGYRMSAFDVKISADFFPKDIVDEYEEEKRELGEEGECLKHNVFEGPESGLFTITGMNI